jgi:hypothetical protein
MKTKTTKTMRTTNTGHRTFAITLGALALALLFVPSAKASCGGPAGLGSRSPIKLPMLNLAQENDLSLVPGVNDSIVGLWHVIYTANGALFNESLDMWHSDGTEFENVHLSPASGNICLGVWKQVAPRTVRLHHIGWLFNALDPTANATNTFTIDETNTVAPNGVTYSGKFTFKVYDLNGNYIPNSEVEGTIAATRITVN